MSRMNFLIILVISVILLAFFFNRGFAFYDEGFILHGAQRVLQGEIPYRDFDFIYTPVTIYLVAAIFKLFGESILIGRLLVLVVGVLTSLLIFSITYKISKNRIFSYLSALIYLSWGPSHINFPWPTLFAFSSGLLAAFFLETNPFAAGVMMFVTFLFKQNFGLATLIVAIVFFVLRKKKRVVGEIKGFFCGSISAGFIYIGYLFFTDSLIPFFNNFYLYSIKSVLFQGAFATSFPSGIKAFFYLLPGLISLAAVFVAYKRQRENIIFPLFTLFFYIFGIRPTTDYVHLTFLLAGTGIPLSIFIRALKNNKFLSVSIYFKEYRKFIETIRNKWKLIVIYAVYVLLIFIGFYTAIFKNYYRWDSPLIKQNYFISDQKAKIFVDRKFSVVAAEIISFINQNSKKDDYIFVFYNAPMFYFLTGRQNPTRYVNFSPDLSLGKIEKQVIEDLINKNVRLIITHEAPDIWGNPLITKYILNNFQKKKEIFEFGLWKRE
ncbi:hypothetical protein HY612_02755 [Candidatus Roizmanbacteria bacterium]|nr:hypothetical protein [Candidatus Roizmanbacteria bacterium]